MIKNLLLGLLLGLVLLSSGAFASFTVDVVSTNPAPVVAGDYADITLRFKHNICEKLYVKQHKHLFHFLF